MKGAVYCVKCKKKTDQKGKAQIVKTRTGRHMLKLHCAKCGTTKTRFLSTKQAAELKKHQKGGFLPLIAPLLGMLAGKALS